MTSFVAHRRMYAKLAAFRLCLTRFMLPTATQPIAACVLYAGAAGSIKACAWRSGLRPQQAPAEARSARWPAGHGSSLFLQHLMPGLSWNFQRRQPDCRRGILLTCWPVARIPVENLLLLLLLPLGVVTVLLPQFMPSGTQAKHHEAWA